MKSLLLFLAVFCIASAYTKIVEDFRRNPCISRNTCHECIQTPTCAWCFDPNFGNNDRCYRPSSSNSLTNMCREEYILNPDNEMQIILYKELSRAQSVSSSLFPVSRAEIIQVAPQHINLKLRKNDPYKFRMHYTQTEDYPIDLYFIMDHSKTMESEKENLANLADLLLESLPNITTNFRVGFGSFDRAKTSCENCRAPYAFRNHMALSINTNQFSAGVRTAMVSDNLDASGGVLDALIQGIVCRKEIGWRANSRKLLIFSTNADFHNASVEKLGAIILPNDGLCHLDYRSGYYTHSRVQDYPSVSQINLKIKENAINIIFAIPEEKIHIYRQLEMYIEGSSTAKLAANSANVVELVKKQYQQISSSVEMKHNAVNGIKVKYYSSCLDPNGSITQTNKCDNIRVGDSVHFNVEIEVTACPKDPKDWKQTLQLYPVGINESLIVDLEMLCSCPCEYPGHITYKEFATECKGHGVYKCGICECNPAYFGRHCQCSTNELSGINNTQNCRPDNVSTIECSGKGFCVCGQCECQTPSNKDEVIYGLFCECDNFSCDHHNGVICSGPDHGVCDCGKCQCSSPWSGPACSSRAPSDSDI